MPIISVDGRIRRMGEVSRQRICGRAGNISTHLYSISRQTTGRPIPEITRSEITGSESKVRTLPRNLPHITISRYDLG